MSSTFLLHHNLSFLIRDVTVWWSKTSPCSGRPKGKSIHCLRSAAPQKGSSAFPSSFLSELPLGRLPAFLPRCVSQTSMDLAEPTLALGTVSLPRLDAEPLLNGSHRALGEPQPQGGTVISRCARPWSSPERAHSELTAPSGSVLGWKRANNTCPPELDL